MAKLKTKHIVVSENELVHLVKSDIDRVYLKVHNSEEHGVSIRIDGTDTSVNANSGRLHPGEELCLQNQASKVDIWCMSDSLAYVDIIEVIG